MIDLTKEKISKMEDRSVKIYLTYKSSRREAKENETNISRDMR